MIKLLNLDRIKEILKKNTVVLSSVAVSITNPSYKEINKVDFNSICKDSIVKIHLNDVTNDDLYYLSSSVKELSIKYSYYIDSLDMIPFTCPNLESLSIDYCPLISDYSFIKECKNLKSFNVGNSAFVTDELVEYLDENNIVHNIQKKDIEVANRIDDIYKRIIIGEGLSNKEKIRAITLYIMNNYEYDMDYFSVSNSMPLESFLKSHKGVCTSYSYLASALLTKAGIENYEVRNKEHIWNLVKNDGKYYYLDVANLDYNNLEFFVRNTDNYMYYMSDPNVDFLSTMSAYSKDDVIIPDSIIKDIDDSEKYKSIDERFCTGFISYYLKYVLLMGLGVGLIKYNFSNKKRKRKKMNTKVKALKR